MRLFILVWILVVANGVEASQPAMKKVGEARLKVMFWSVYDARLYTADGSYSPGTRPLRLELQYLMDIASEELVKKTASSWKSQGQTHQSQQQWLQFLGTLWPDVKENDIIALDLDAQDQSTFYFNGKLLGSLPDRDFGQQFIDIWLSDNTTQPRFRRALLGR